eukprot:CAMPEP_0171105100 /NCGR_PEP_ID=MMETSP0766_2-20121228/61981_1 /TAXON_ID=439317 /ORGANISM="Gambierdiscus australes, Strain CAWD 149" /LENGTH=40 /DNA_ID= /DNA_START= /DNA_END= /DNA_ORIENTATION=
MTEEDVSEFMAQNSAQLVMADRSATLSTPGHSAEAGHARL